MATRIVGLDSRIVGLATRMVAGGSSLDRIIGLVGLHFRGVSLATRIVGLQSRRVGLAIRMVGLYLRGVVRSWQQEWWVYSLHS